MLPKYELLKDVGYSPTPKMKQRGKSWISGENETVIFTSTTERETSYEADVPSYPTENGYETADSVIKKPMSITVKGRIKSHSEIESLEKMYAGGNLCLYHTPNYEHSNIVIERLAIKETAEVGNEWEVTMTLKQVKSTTTSISEVVDTSSQAGNSNVASNADETEESPYTNEVQEAIKIVESSTTGTLMDFALGATSAHTPYSGFLNVVKQAGKLIDWIKDRYEGHSEDAPMLVFKANITNALTPKATRIMSSTFGGKKND